MEFKVVKIVSEYLVVIDYGLKDHAEVGDVLEIYQTGEMVTDPETNKELGTLDITKGRIKVKNVYENMSLCISNEKVNVVSPQMKSFSQTLYNISTTFNKFEMKPLDVSAEQITGGYHEGDKALIKLLDPVKIIKSKYLDSLPEDEEDFEE